MKFGICVGNLEEAAVVKQLGYDYFEFPFSKFADMSDEDFEAFNLWASTVVDRTRGSKWVQAQPAGS